MHNSRFKFLQIKVWDRISTKDVQRRQSGLKSGEVVDPGKKIDFSRQIFENFHFFRLFHTKILIFPGKNWSFTATSGQIILILFNSHHFRTYFLYVISYNNVTTRPRPPAASRSIAQNLGVATPKPPGLTPLIMSMIDAALWVPNHNLIN